MMAFPYHTIPDGTVLAPHHYLYGLLLVLITIGIVWDNYKDREPLLTILGATVGLFGFLFVWPQYHQAGAILSVAGPIIVIFAVLFGWVGLSVGGTWDDYPIRWRISAIIGSVIALDDVLQHAFGWPAPFDTVWKLYFVDRVGLLAIALLAIAVGAIVILSVLEDSERSN